MAYRIGKIVKQKFATFNSDHASFNFLPTYDVDIAYAYKYKPVTTQLAGAAKELLSLRWGELSARMKVAAGKTNDPFDTYDWLDSFHKNMHCSRFIFFYLRREEKDTIKASPPFRWHAKTGEDNFENIRHRHSSILAKRR